MRAGAQGGDRFVRAELVAVTDVQVAGAPERRESESESSHSSQASGPTYAASAGRAALPRHTGQVSSVDDLLADAPLGAAVAALAERNRHHLEQMTDAERQDALSHWHDLAVAVLTAAGAALGGGEGVAERRIQGRAVIVLEDAGGDEVAVHASFFPQLEDLGGEVLVTPAQAAALELLEAMTGGEDEDDEL